MNIIKTTEKDTSDRYERNDERVIHHAKKGYIQNEIVKFFAK